MSANNVIKSQYLYINTANRENGTQSLFSISLAPGIKCNDNERLSIAIVSFKLTRTWNWLNQTNNVLTLKNQAKDIAQTITIPEGNYTFRKLAYTINQQVRTEIPTLTDFKMKYDPSRNMFGFSGSSSTQLCLNVGNSIADAIKWPKDDIMLVGETKVYYQSTSPPTIDKASEFRLYIENVPTSATAPNFENDTSNQLQPSQCVFVMRADIAPGATAYYSAAEILFQLDLDEKQVQKLVFSLRDEKGLLVDYAPDYLFTVRIDTISADQTATNEQLALMKEMVDYQRLQFVGSNIDSV